MRYSFYLMLILLISCKGNTEKADPDFFSNFQLSLDTIIIDPGDEILFVKHQLLNADMGSDGKYFYNFNGDDHTLEKINLDELRLEEKLPFEKEGPNGTGPGIGVMRIVDESHVSITAMYQISLFSMEGEKYMTVYYENFSLANWHNGGDLLSGTKVVLDPDTKQLYGLIQGYEDKRFVLGLLHLEEYETSRVELKSFERLPDYSFEYTISGKATVHMSESPKVGIEKFGKKVVLSNEITSALAWYDTEMDSLFMKTYDSQLTANQKEKEYKKVHETPEEFKVEYARYLQEINFMPPFWDQDGQMFLRFSYIENESRADVYLTAYDEDLKMLGETLVPQLTKKPARHFAKDGKIWLYENINDEMGFIRLEMRE
ncbi:protein of unknown function [Cyclobacterium lianum]|uniref:DUF4221 domain-containing protein n=1 Tax=Cyclobacterium lianum TaxID=388280 RepID=A0A1M7Q4U1_9BACT|nr:DUF4221 family protein [Cyclobacterium lianum]SHN25279.1 protein of unknown function [Cyclobacterium lianum]